MASAIESLIQAPEQEKKERGTEFTPAEIFQQPFIWRDSFRRVKEAKSKLTQFLTGAGILGDKRPGRIYMTGAGTSDFVGRSLKALVRSRLQVEADHTASTDLVTHPCSACAAKTRSREVARLPGRGCLPTTAMRWP